MGAARPAGPPRPRPGAEDQPDVALEGGIPGLLAAAVRPARTRTGRRTRYTVNHDSLFRHPAQDGHRVGPLLSLLAASGEDAGTTPEPEDT